MANIEFDDIDEMKRNRDLENEGTVIGFPGDRWIKMAAATDANPQWRGQSEEILAELGRLDIAKAPPKRVREYLAPKFAELLGRDWGGWKSRGVEIPYSKEALAALFLVADDVYAVVNRVVYDTKAYRAKRVDAVASEGNDSQPG